MATGLRYGWILGLALCLCPGAEKAFAQDAPVPVLHVYTNLLQLPTLVLNSARDPLTTPIDPNRFSVSIDGGPWFRATHVHRAGGDPISLSVLVDLKGDTSRLSPKMREAMAALASTGLHPTDHVSIYATGCALTRTLLDSPADATRLGEATDAAVASWKQHAEKAHGKDCADKEHLWDSLIRVLDAMKDEPGRRAILVLSDGKDHGSKYDSDTVARMSNALSVAIFGVSYASPFQSTAITQNVTINNTGRRGGVQATVSAADEAPDNFRSMCETSGGMVMTAHDLILPEKLKTFVQMLRERYVLEFPRPMKGTAGAHGIRVRIEKDDNYFVRASGVTFPLQDAKLADDPNTIQTGPAAAPEEGKKRRPN